jgi:hypothetical protein
MEAGVSPFPTAGPALSFGINRKSGVCILPGVRTRVLGGATTLPAGVPCAKAPVAKVVIASAAIAKNATFFVIFFPQSLVTSIARFKTRPSGWLMVWPGELCGGRIAIDRRSLDEFLALPVALRVVRFCRDDGRVTEVPKLLAREKPHVYWQLLMAHSSIMSCRAIHSNGTFQLPAPPRGCTRTLASIAHTQLVALFPTIPPGCRPAVTGVFPRLANRLVSMAPDMVG